MGKGNGGTRSQGPAQAAGGRENTPVDAGYRASETSFKYSYDPDKVKFRINDISRELGIEEVTAKDLRTVDDFSFSSVQRDNDGKFDLGRGDYWFTEKMSFAKAVGRAVEEIKTGYKNNENVRDHYMVVENKDNSLWATVQAVMDDNNKARITISRYKGL